MTTMLLTMLFSDTRLLGSAVRVTTEAQARRLLKAGKFVLAGPAANDGLEDIPHAL